MTRVGLRSTGRDTLWTLGEVAITAQVAEIVGYDSEAAFSPAFKKAFGAAPGTWRRSIG
jgi:AraC-like DNA-binding protein